MDNDVAPVRGLWVSTACENHEGGGEGGGSGCAVAGASVGGRCFCASGRDVTFRSGGRTFRTEAKGGAPRTVKSVSLGAGCSTGAAAAGASGRAEGGP